MNPVSLSEIEETYAQPRKRKSWPRLVLWGLAAVPGAGLVAFSQTGHWHWDEGFRLVAVQLINAGKRPYVDFFYPDPPLYAYLNAGWTRVFGESWRSAHLLSALLTSAAILLVAGFVFSRLRASGWGLAGAITAALLVGLHLHVIWFGTISQSYGLCLFLTVAAFRLVIAAVARPKGGLPFWAGLCAGGAAASSLLTAPVGPLLWLWLVWQNWSGARWKKGAQFLGGWVIPFLPLLWLAWQAPRRVLFSVVEFHLFYRMLDPAWKASKHNLRVLMEWLSAPQDFSLGLLAAVGLLFLVGRSEWDARRRAEFYLCAWLAGGLGVYLATLELTAPQYFVLTVPFLSILAAVGVYAIGSRMWSSGRPGWLVLAVMGLFAMGLAKTAYQQRREFQPCWPVIEELAREINRLTPSDGLVHTDEHIYFAARRLPPPGLENRYGRLLHLRLRPALAAAVGAVSESQMNEWFATGRFATVLTGGDDLRKLEWLGVLRFYARHTRVHNCYLADGYIFWQWVADSQEPR
jgi:4-amino-4-deoxy-L-arabinose transferase-like glycosyltransferase